MTLRRRIAITLYFANEIENGLKIQQAKVSSFHNPQITNFAENSSTQIAKRNCGITININSWGAQKMSTPWGAQRPLSGRGYKWVYNF